MSKTQPIRPNLNGRRQKQADNDASPVFTSGDLLSVYGGDQTLTA